jgi:hypothetical protein
MGGSNNKNPTGFSKERLTNTLGSKVESFAKSKPADVFDKPLYAGLGDTTRGGINELLSGADNPIYSQGAQNSLDITADVAAGNRFGENDAYYKTLMDDATSAASSPFVSSGTFGSDRHREAVASGLGRVQGARYDNDVARMERAQAALPGRYAATLQPSSTKIGAGQMLDADRQAGLLAENDLFQRNQNQNYDHLAKSLGLLGSGPFANQQERQDPTAMDYLGLGAGALFSFL